MALARAGLRLKHPKARVLSCAGHLDVLGYRISRDGRQALGRARQRMVRRLKGSWFEPMCASVERSVASSAGVLLF
ncbi:MAG: hypothetical protein KC620_21400 [Myxococcales bacterium]|nr:hypothetical protein [Myxococcales bacterium]